MTNTSLGSITLWLERLKDGDDEAARQLWDRYFERLANLAERRLKHGGPSAAGDDVALSALKSFFMGARQGRYAQLSGRTELWSLLIAMTVRKAINELRRQYAQKRSPRIEDREIDIAEVIERGRCHESMIDVADALAVLLDSLDDELLRRIALLRLEGYTVLEIARQVACSERTVARKLNRIRQEWMEAAS